MNSQRHKRSAAFTLLEIMVAIALLALVVMAIYSSWNSILKGSRVALDAAAASQRERMTMRTIQDALLCACMFTGNPTNYIFEATTESEFTSMSFVAHLPDSFLRGGKFGPLNVRRLQFTVENGTDGKPQLVLRQRPLNADFTKDELDHPLVLARNVAEFQVFFEDPKTGEDVTEWTATNQLPRVATIKLGLGRLDQFSSKAQEEWAAVVTIPSQPVPGNLQAVAPQGAPPPNPGNPGNPANSGKPGVAGGGQGVNVQPGGQLNIPR